MCLSSLSAARFIVHVRSPGVIMLQNKQEPQHYLAIRDGNLCTVGGHCMSAMQGYIGTFMQSGGIVVCCFVGYRWTIL